MRRLYNPIDRHLFEGFHLRRLVLTNDQLSDAEFLARGDHDEIVLDNNEQLWSGSAASTSDRKRTRRLSLRNTSIDSLSQRGVDISQFADVEELILAGNELRAVSAAELGPFERLRVLDLSDNSVDQFAGNFSSVLPRLDTLNLTDNRLETLPESTWRLLLPSFPDFPAFPCLFSPCPLFSPPMFSHFLQFFPHQSRRGAFLFPSLSCFPCRSLSFSPCPLSSPPMSYHYSSISSLPESTWRPLVERLKSSVLLSGNRLHYTRRARSRSTIVSVLGVGSPAAVRSAEETRPPESAEWQSTPLQLRFTEKLRL